MPKQQPPSSPSPSNPNPNPASVLLPFRTKAFILSQYECKGITRFNSSDYKETGRPRCYGIEKKLMSSMELQNQFRAMLDNDYQRDQFDNEEFFEQFKEMRGKMIAEGENGFKLKGYGTTHYPVLEYANGAKRESITLQKPVVEPGILVQEEKDETFWVVKFSGYEISNDVRAIDDPDVRRQLEIQAEQKQNGREIKRASGAKDDAVEFERHVEIEIDLAKAGEKVSEMAGKTVENVRKVGEYLKAELQDEFVPRVGEMSQKIVMQFPKTAVRCQKTAIDIFKWWQSDGDDEE